MKAIEMRETGGPAVLQLVDRPRPELTGPDDILVRLMAAGINPMDTKIRARGSLIPDGLPAVLGCDGAGVVEAVGADVTRFKPGDEVWFCHGGLGGPVGNYARIHRPGQPVCPGQAARDRFRRGRRRPPGAAHRLGGPRATGRA